MKLKINIEEELNDLFKKEMDLNKVITGDITPFQALQFEKIKEDLSQLIFNVVEQNKPYWKEV